MNSTFYLLMNWTGFILARSKNEEDRLNRGVADVDIPILELVGFTIPDGQFGPLLDAIHLQYLKAIQKHPGVGYSEIAKLMKVNFKTAYLRTLYLKDRNLVRMVEGKNGKHLFHVDYSKICIIEAGHMKKEHLADLTMDAVINLSTQYKRREVSL